MDTDNREFSSDDVALVLEDAKALIENKGWTRGEYQRGQRYCVVGALQAARLNLGFSDLVQAAAETELEKAASAMEGGNYQGNVISWNDVQKSKKPVVNLLTRAAKKMRNPEVTP